MAPSVVEQFAEMLNARFSLSDKAELTHKPKKMIRETITYPKLVVTQNNDSCLNPSLYFEHALSCGHIVSTALPSEPCAPNCHYVAADGGELDRSLRNKEAMKMKNGNKVSDKEFYCDACVEEEIEVKIPSELSSSNAEERRAMLRAKEAKTRGKAIKFRKCYIALKVTSVPCHSDGTLSLRYTPREKRHPFDLALPQTGENMFEDVNASGAVDEGTITERGENPIVRTKDICVTKAKEDSTRTVYSLVFTDDEYTENDSHNLNDNNGSLDRHKRGSLTQALTSTPGGAWARVAPLPKTAHRVTASDMSNSKEVCNGYQALASERRPRKRSNHCLDEDNNEDSEEEGEIITQRKKKRRNAPVTRQTAKSRTKRTSNNGML
jgi:hypothetical protein